MAIKQLTGRFKFVCDYASERLTFNPGSDRIGTRIYAKDTKVTYDWDGTEWPDPPGNGPGFPGNLDGGSPDTQYEMISPIDGGTP